MSRWFALDNEGDMISLGEHEDFDSADTASTEIGCAWIIEEEGAREWLTSLAILLGPP